jgi:hypothetical protein
MMSCATNQACADKWLLRCAWWRNRALVDIVRFDDARAVNKRAGPTSTMIFHRRLMQKRGIMKREKEGMLMCIQKYGCA